MQFDPPFKVITPLGPAMAVALVDGRLGVEWLTFIISTGESWFWRNFYIRLAPDVTEGHGSVSPFLDLPSGLAPHIARYRANGWLPCNVLPSEER